MFFFFVFRAETQKLQGRFGAEEAASALHVFVADMLREDAPDFDLKTPPPVR